MQVNSIYRKTLNKVKMSQGLRKEVLSAYKSLHRTRQKIFDGDEVALKASRDKIRKEYKQNQHVTDPTAISELVQFSKSVEKELLQTVVQAKEVKPGLFEAKIRPETIRFDSTPYKENTS